MPDNQMIYVEPANIYTSTVELTDADMQPITEPERVLTYMDDGTPITEFEMVAAIARGQLQTEAGTEALRRGEVDEWVTVNVRDRADGFDVENPTPEMQSMIRDWLNKGKLIETLERAVLKSWRDSWQDSTMWHCKVCELAVASRHDEIQHASGCIVPALLEKYE